MDRESRRRIVSRFVEVVWCAFGMLELAMGLRFLLKLIAANPNSPFAAFLYGITGPFLTTFEGLSRTSSVQGMVFETHTLVAMLVYFILGWVVTETILLLMMPSLEYDRLPRLQARRLLRDDIHPHQTGR